MSQEKNDGGKIPFEAAIDQAGFGLYSYAYVALTGCIIIAYACIVYCTSLLLPTSACELETTSAQQGIIAATPIVAVMLGATPWGYLGDTRGRRGTLILSLLCASVLNIIGSFSVNWIMLCIMMFITTFACAGQYSLSMTLLSECVPMAKRNLVVLLVTSIFLLVQGLMAVVGLGIIPFTFSYHIAFLGIYWNSWRTLMAVYTTPSILTAIWLYYMSESPKYLLAKGDEEGALEVLRTIHRKNRMKTEFQVKGLLREVQKGSTGESSVKEQIVPLFKAPLLKNTIIMTLLFLFQQVGSLQVWFPTIANQFIQMIEDGAPMNQTLCSVLGTSQDAVADPDAVPCSLNTTAMLIVLATGALQSLFNLVASLGVVKFGRRNSAIVITAMCGLSGIVINLVPNTIASATFFIIMLLGIMVIGLYTAIAVAIFPTHLRALAVALTMSGARIGQIISIQVLNFLLVTNCDLGFYIFATLFASSAIVAAFLPDDRKLLKPAPPAPRTQSESSEL